MAQEKDELENIKKLKKDLKPKLYWPIWNTIICSGPPLNLIFKYFLVRDIKNPTAAIILTVIAMIWAAINWYWYVKQKNDFKKSWEKISIELHTLNPQEEPSKDTTGKIFDILMIIEITSLVMFFVFTAIEILAKPSFFKYLALISIFIFLITGGVLIIMGIIQIFRLIKAVIKCSKLKEVLKREIKK